MVCALAGRRIDQPNTEAPRFPVENVARVRERLLAELGTETRAIVCSAACGADLIALDLAGRLGIRRRIVLPFEPERFRRTSVVDRPGDWGALFDKIIDEVEKQDDVLILECNSDDSAAYAHVNSAIISEAENLAKGVGDVVVAMVVWDGKSRGDDDLTAALRDEAKRRRYAVIEVPTLSD
jgi:hypothetical protein